MKNYIILILSFFVFSSSFAQDAKKEIEKEKTKMDAFASKTGTIMKFVDFNLSGIKQSYGKLIETRIRKVSSGTLSTYFFQIVKTGQYSNPTASIEYNDLIEVIKAIQPLKTDVEKDVATNPDYLENKFTTVDGFQVGYYISKGKATWFLKLEKYGSDSSVFIDNVNQIEQYFEEAKNKIDEIKTK